MHNEFIENGYPVFGIYNILPSGECECGQEDCKAVGKHPRTSSWQHTPVWSDEQIEVMEELGQFNTGYGVLCRDLLVIDVDNRNGGTESYRALYEAIPEVAGAGLVVNTGSGNGSKHYYFKLPTTSLALERHLTQYKGIDFQTGNCFVIGPNSMHKTGSRYTVDFGSVDDIDDAPQALLDLLLKPERRRVEYDGTFMDVSHQDIADMLTHINPNMPYDDWVSIGMAIHHTLNGDGFTLWNDWSSRGDTYNADNMDVKWHSFGRSSRPVTIGTIIYYAQQGGWSVPVTFTDTTEDTPTTTDDDLLNVDHIDLLSPPGRVGRVMQYLQGINRYDRHWLCLGTAINVVGNIMGLRYTDDYSYVTTNTFMFFIAGSATGKEAVMQGATNIYKEVGLTPALHGSIKSEQEIIRNLIRHQAALYNIDEFGYLLAKVASARKSGSAGYLEAVIGILMSAYSKANGSYLLSGDVRDNLKAEMIKELSRLRKQQADDDENPFVNSQIDSLERTLASIDNGLEKPFLSLVGYATPSTFDGMVDYEQASAGFIGRACIFWERETNPRAKRDFTPVKLDTNLVRELQGLFLGGEYDTTNKRIECYKDRIVVPTTNDARRCLDAALTWFEDYAEQQKGSTGLEAVVRRGFELMCKASLILSDGDTRTLHHVQYAFKLIKKDIDTKINLVMSNESSDSGQKLIAKIRKHIGDGQSETFGVLRNRLRSYDEKDIQTALTKMEQSGEIVLEKTTNYKSKRETVRISGGS